MTGHTLEHLLRQVDQAAARPAPLPADLADRVIRQDRRRRAAKLGGALVVLLAATGVAAVLFQAPGAPAAPVRLTEAPPAAPVPAEIDSEEAQVESRLVVVEHLLAREQQRRRLARAQAIIARPDPLERLDRQLEQTAFVIVAQADRKVRQWNLTSSAARDYRRVIELFPRTRWATVARARLIAIEG